MSTEGIVAVTAIFGSMLAALIIGLFFVDRCPECKRRWAVVLNGETRVRQSGWFQIEETLSVCKYCGHRVWKKDGRGGG